MELQAFHVGLAPIVAGGFGQISRAGICVKATEGCRASPRPRYGSLPEFMNFKPFGKTISVVNIKFELLLSHPVSQ